MINLSQINHVFYISIQSPNQEHRHSKIGFITPHQKHTGQSDALMKNRTEVYQAAKNKHPSRWSGQIRNWESTQTVFLNPEKSVQKDGKTAA